jgi:hypothetical protein
MADKDASIRDRWTGAWFLRLRGRNPRAMPNITEVQAGVRLGTIAGGFITDTLRIRESAKSFDWHSAGA